MGEQHDSWVEGLGVTGFTSSEATGSVWSGAGEMIKSGADALGHVAKAELDLAMGASDAMRGGVEQVGAGVLDAYGAHGTAESLRGDARKIQDRSGENFKRAGQELRGAKDDVFGGDENVEGNKSKGASSKGSRGGDASYGGGGQAKGYAGGGGNDRAGYGKTERESYGDGGGQSM